MSRAKGKRGLPRMELPEVSDLAVDKSAFPDDGRFEPTARLAREFADASGSIRLDPSRVAFEPNPLSVARRPRWGPIGSLVLHLLPLLAILYWPRTLPEISRPIPIQLVIEQAPPPLQLAEPKHTAKPPKGRHASDDFAPVEGRNVTGRSDPAVEPRVAQPPATETQTVLVVPPLPKPTMPLSEQVTSDDPLPSAVETRTAVASLGLPPKAAPPKRPARRKTVDVLQSAWPLPLDNSPPATVHSARLRGADAIRDEYCAQALSLTMRHIGLLPLSLTGVRKGQTVLSIRVLGDGTINGVTVARSSGYPDIDELVERMVLAVGRFPPLPTWMGPSMDFTFQLHFPNNLQR